MRRTRWSRQVWVLLGLAVACASGNDRGRALYAEGRFIEAAEVYEHSEARLKDFAQAERAQYGLYRGMTLLRLGDLNGAEKWLTYAQTTEGTARGSLLSRETTALKQARTLLEQARANATRSPDPLSNAVAHANTNNALVPDKAPTNERPNSPEAESVPTEPNKLSP
jgi:tetratricopeptide (TPR) repeat protein